MPWTAVCPRCQTTRPSEELWLTMVGSIPIACRDCAPDPPHQEYHLNLAGAGAGPYRAGSVLYVDGERFLELT